MCQPISLGCASTSATRHRRRSIVRSVKTQIPEQSRVLTVRGRHGLHVRVVTDGLLARGATGRNNDAVVTVVRTEPDSAVRVPDREKSRVHSVEAMGRYSVKRVQGTVNRAHKLPVQPAVATQSGSVKIVMGEDIITASAVLAAYLVRRVGALRVQRVLGMTTSVHNVGMTERSPVRIVQETQDVGAPIARMALDGVRTVRTRHKRVQTVAVPAQNDVRRVRAKRQTVTAVTEVVSETVVSVMAQHRSPVIAVTHGERPHTHSVREKEKFRVTVETDV